jgi:hypothetical protein
VRSSRRVQWGLVASLIFLAVLSRLRFNGLILNFDYGIYQPDGSHYTYRTLTFLGVDSNLAAQRVVDWYRIHGIKNDSFDVNLLSPENKEVWGLVAPRILYSLLSIPFVYVFGIAGMMAIPILSFMVLIWAIFRLSEIKNQQGIGILLVIGLTTSPTVLRWMVANITDSLLAGLFGIAVLLFLRNSSGKAWYFSLVSLILLTSSTRFTLPIWIAISLVYLINGRRNCAIVIFLTSTIAFIPTYLFMPSNAILPANVDTSGFQKSVQLFFSFFNVGFIEIAQLAALDRILLVIVALALIASLLNFRQLPSQMYLAVLMSVWLIGAINGTLGVNFRYQLPLIPFACWTIISNLTQFTPWSGRRRVNVIGKET